MIKTNKNLTILITVFILMLGMGIVYAAASGNLIFSGSANLGSDVKLDIIPVTEVCSLPSGSTGTMTVNPNGQSATISVNLINPGDELTFTFNMENTGSMDAKVNMPVTTNENPKLIISGTYASINGTTVATGSASNNYTIVVGWSNIASSTSISNTATFTIQLPYQLAS